jgi:hypothetical protein
MSSTSALAGPCARAIDRMQSQLDAKIEATAKAGKFATESRAARLHHQPTPASIAAAEGRLGEGSGTQAALAGLARAREADRANNAPACKRALAESQRAIGR